MPFLKKYKLFALFFLLVFVANIVFLHYLTSYVIVAKPMIMCSLIGFYITQVSTQSKSFLIALIAALFGDIFLLFPGDQFFMLGLGAFLIMQLLYGFTFSRKIQWNKATNFIPALPTALLAFVFLVWMWPTLGEMKLPVLLYTLAITGMVSIAWSRNRSLAGYTFVAWGSAFFMMSDLLLAFQKFTQPITAGHDLVMATYMIAQFLIISGLVQEATVIKDPS